jgi:cytochrome c oxidase subunit 2
MPGASVLQSALDAAGPQAWHIERLWWLMFWVTTAVFVAVMAVVIAAVIRALALQPDPDDVRFTGRPRTPDSTPAVSRREPGAPARADRDARYVRIVALATAATVITLFVLLVASVWTGRAIASPGPTAAVVINVTGHQWWWEAEYEDPVPSQRVTTANEFHIPVGRPVVLKVTSRDVIHSFWVPNLHGKRDLIPGYTTSIWLQADRPGTYRGQCAEFCGHQHANMALYVTAEPDAQFQAWLANQRKEAVQPPNDEARRGRDVFLRATCTQCHTIRGTIAGARMGPDLTHLATRGTIAAGRLPNTRGHLAGWVLDPQSVKPGNQMPPNSLPGADLQALLTYLESLK